MADIKRFSVTIRGTKPLLMHNGELADPLNPWTQKLKEFTSKRKKSEDDIKKIAEIEFKGGLYHDEKLGPYIPGFVLDSMLKNGAKKRRLGTIFDSCVSASEDMHPLRYDGPRDIDGLWSSMRFMDRRGAGIQKSRVIRTRPKFSQWSLAFTVCLFPCELNATNVKQAIVDAGIYVGLGDFRPKFGTFDLDDKDFKEI